VTPNSDADALMLRPTANRRPAVPKDLLVPPRQSRIGLLNGVIRGVQVAQELGWGDTPASAQDGAKHEWRNALRFLPYVFAHDPVQ
jgi:hypothetical protein